MTKKYRSLQFSIDGQAWIFDHEGDTPEEVWKAVNDQGSKWIFYPLPFVVTNNPGQDFKHSKIIEACENLDFLNGKTINTARKYIEEYDISWALE